MPRPIKSSVAFALLVMNLWSCAPTAEEVKDEIRATEKAFMEMAESQGLAKAFQYFAAENGQLVRGNKAIRGGEAIYQFYKDREDPNAQLTWEPENIYLSASMDMAYSTGSYSYTTLDTLGNEIKSEGVFGTVWIKENNEEWKYLAD
ncbi:DUF4440 domain-containing protein [Marinoscillum sp. MHG1-6]|uniref:YybH family protein n=1 Tax=Marinoscillum sp. MHG1-6 TaxID=2959627 RepID=UPI0021582EF5|nr:DUF4440 domain-containing protein [Marinoscillum sp. MHG1-6]